MKTVRTVLNELKWRSDRDFSRVEVEYIHRGAPEDLATVSGADITSLEAWMMIIRKKEAPEQLPGRRLVTAVPGEAAIPYHRVTRVLYDGKTVFDRTSGRDLIDEENIPPDTSAVAGTDEDEGIYPEPPSMPDGEPNVVDAHDDDVSAADFRDVDEAADKGVRKGHNGLGNRTPEKKAPVKKAPPKKAPVKETHRKAHPSKIVKKASGRNAKRK